MKTLEFFVKDQLIERVACDTLVVVAQSVNYLYAHFTFSDEWQGIKTAIFKRNGIASIHVPLDQGDTCLVPWEWLAVDTDTKGTVSVYCGNRITANEEHVQIFKSGYEDGQAPQPPPTPGEIDQLKQLLGDHEAQKVADAQGVHGFRYRGGNLEVDDGGWKAIPTGGGGGYVIGSGLKLDANILSVDTINDVVEDNTQPITSGAVYTEVGNIETLLKTI